jgi:hypothetical protein
MRTFNKPVRGRKAGSVNEDRAAAIAEAAANATAALEANADPDAAVEFEIPAFFIEAIAEGRMREETAATYISGELGKGIGCKYLPPEFDNETGEETEAEAFIAYEQ